MTNLAKRIGHSLISLALLFTAVFFLIRIIPGDPARLMAGAAATPEQVEQLRRQLGLDKSAWLQFLDFIAGLFQGDLGISNMSHRAVTLEIGSRLPMTLLLVAVAMLLAVAIAVPLGVLAARYQNGPLDLVTTGLAIGLTSIPAFWFALILVDWLSVRQALLPSSGAGTWQHLVLPSAILAATQVGIIARLIRSSVVETLGADYVRTARSKGVAPSTIMWRHSLRNALVPAITVIGLQMGLLIGGAVVTETVFNWPGIGQLLIQAVQSRDYPLMQGLILLFGVTFIVANLIVDTINMIADPRLRTS